MSNETLMWVISSAGLLFVLGSVITTWIITKNKTPGFIVGVIWLIVEIAVLIFTILVGKWYYIVIHSGVISALIVIMIYFRREK